MSEDGIPMPIAAGDASQSYRGIERELDIIRGRLTEGSRTFGELRTALERLRDDLAELRRHLEGRIAAAALAEAGANESLRRSAETRAISHRAELEAEIRALTARIHPRATSGRVLAWIGAGVLALAPSLGWLWLRFDALDSRIRANEAHIVEIGARVAGREGTR
jgi:chromosome segregation ATPase